MQPHTRVNVDTHSPFFKLHLKHCLSTHQNQWPPREGTLLRPLRLDAIASGPDQREVVAAAATAGGALAAEMEEKPSDDYRRGAESTLSPVQ